MIYPNPRSLAAHVTHLSSRSSSPPNRATSASPRSGRKPGDAPAEGDRGAPARVLLEMTVAIAAGLAVLSAPQILFGQDGEGGSFRQDSEAVEPTEMSPSGYTLDSLTGNDYVWDRSPATQSWLESPRAVAVDTAGNLYIADWGHHRIRKVDGVTGTIDTIAGTGEPGYSGDGGPAREALVGFPAAVAVDGQGNLYIPAGTVVRKVDPMTGTISVVAGTGERGHSGDGGPATEARLFAGELAVDAAGNLYIAGRYRIRKVDGATGTISTVAGTGERGFDGDGGPATEAQLGEMRGLAVDGSGSLYVVDYGNDRIRKVDGATGVIDTIAGNGESRYSGDGGPAIEAGLSRLEGVAVDGTGNLYLADWYRVRKVDGATGTIHSIAGTGERGHSGDGGPAAEARVGLVEGVAVDGAGNVYIAAHNRIRKLDAATGMIDTIAGGRQVDNFLAMFGKLSRPRGLAVDGFGNIFIADYGNNRIRQSSLSAGWITTRAGMGEGGDSGDGGRATRARLAFPVGVAVDASGNIYIADTYNHRIRKVEAGTGTISTVAGTGLFGFGEDVGDGGPASQAMLAHPHDVAVDVAGNLYIADRGGSRIRKVDAATGTISTIAGTGGRFGHGYGGDGGPATEAKLRFPIGVAVDGAGNVYIADVLNSRVRKVDASTGTISTIAGTGRFGYSGDGGPATEAMLAHPEGVAVDTSGDVYIADTLNFSIRKVDACTGTISTIAGTGMIGNSRDGGPATEARLGPLRDVAIAGNGRIYLSDGFNHRIRVLKPGSGSVSAGCPSDPSEEQ